jgi:hypothetical protein
MKNIEFLLIIDYKEDIKKDHAEVKSLDELTTQYAWKEKILDKDLKKYFNEMQVLVSLRFLSETIQDETRYEQTPRNVSKNIEHWKITRRKKVLIYMSNIIKA